LEKSGVERSNWFGLITFVNKFRKEAKKTVKDETDFVTVNKKLLELFDEYLAKHGKSKVAKEIVDLAIEVKNSRKRK